MVDHETSVDIAAQQTPRCVFDRPDIMARGFADVICGSSHSLQIPQPSSSMLKAGRRFRQQGRSSHPKRTSLRGRAEKLPNGTPTLCWPRVVPWHKSSSRLTPATICTVGCRCWQVVALVRKYWCPSAEIAFETAQFWGYAGAASLHSAYFLIDNSI